MNIKRKKDVEKLKDLLIDKLETEVKYIEDYDDLDTVTQWDFNEHDHMHFRSLSEVIQRLLNNEPVSKKEIEAEIKW